MSGVRTKRSRRRLEPAEVEALSEAVRSSLSILDQAGDAQLDRLIKQLEAEPGTIRSSGAAGKHDGGSYGI